MKLTRPLIAAGVALGAALASRSTDAAGQHIQTTQVLIVGTFHFSNPGHDLHNTQVDDVLQPAYQAQIAAVTSALARFKPTQVDVEWDADTTSARFARYLAGTLQPSRNEVVQLGFRLAKQAGLKEVHGIDADGDFPYEAVQAYAKAHGETAILDAANAPIAASVASQDALLKTKGIAATLRVLNNPDSVKTANAFYREMLRIGGGTAQPGADLLAAWYHRNFLICANILQLAKPGDRIVVIFGAGHAFLLRQCVSETPGMQLVEANGYLP